MGRAGERCRSCGQGRVSVRAGDRDGAGLTPAKTIAVSRLGQDSARGRAGQAGQESAAVAMGRASGRAGDRDGAGLTPAKTRRRLSSKICW
jgi:hypothetical protein